MDELACWVDDARTTKDERTTMTAATSGSLFILPLSVISIATHPRALFQRSLTALCPHHHAIRPPHNAPARAITIKRLWNKRSQGLLPSAQPVTDNTTDMGRQPRIRVCSSETSCRTISLHLYGMFHNFQLKVSCN